MKKNILFQISGSIAAYKSCYIISKLVQNGFEVQTVLSKAAKEFIGPATLEGLTGKSVFFDIYEPSKMMDHICLSKWADLTIVCPATANTINKLAAGIADDAIGNLFLSHNFKKPYLVVPAMNQQMYSNPITQESLDKLKSLKVKVLPTENGHQACGDVGEGRLLDPDKIYFEILSALGAKTQSLEVSV